MLKLDAVELKYPHVNLTGPRLLRKNIMVAGYPLLLIDDSELMSPLVICLLFTEKVEIGKANMVISLKKRKTCDGLKKELSSKQMHNLTRQ